MERTTPLARPRLGLGLGRLGFSGAALRLRLLRAVLLRVLFRLCGAQRLLAKWRLARQMGERLLSLRRVLTSTRPSTWLGRLAGE
jgi:hypothetical protein